MTTSIPDNNSDIAKRHDIFHYVAWDLQTKLGVWNRESQSSAEARLNILTGISLLL